MANVFDILMAGLAKCKSCKYSDDGHNYDKWPCIDCLDGDRWEPCPTDYISRDAVVMSILCAGKIGKQTCIDIIKREPAADVRPVVRGHWITEEEAEKMGDYLRGDTCSVCGHCDWDCTESSSFNFCPNCGADMREEVQE